MQKNDLPQEVQKVLWSYDIDKIDIKKDKYLIIAQVLNFGSRQATEWLFRTYHKDDIARAAAQIPSGQWDKKSLALWSLCFNINPISRAQRVLYGR